jgi:hypothetical protein
VNHSYYVVIAFCLFIGLQKSYAQASGFGIGVSTGEATGISAKVWTSTVNAVDFGIGWSIVNDRTGSNFGFHGIGSRLHTHLDYVWHLFGAIDSPEQFPLYYGIGWRVNSGAGYDPSVAFRAVLGVEWIPHRAPFDAFFELTPSLQLTSATDAGVSVGMGVRYYF